MKRNIYLVSLHLLVVQQHRLDLFRICVVTVIKSTTVICKYARTNTHTHTHTHTHKPCGPIGPGDSIIVVEERYKYHSCAITNSATKKKQATKQTSRPGTTFALGELGPLFFLFVFVTGRIFIFGVVVNNRVVTATRVAKKFFGRSSLTTATTKTHSILLICFFFQPLFFNILLRRNAVNKVIAYIRCRESRFIHKLIMSPSYFSFHFFFF